MTHEERRSRRPDSGGQGRALADRRSGDYGSVLREAFAHWNEGDFEGTTTLFLRFVKRDDLTCFVAVYPSREQAAAGAANPAS